MLLRRVELTAIAAIAGLAIVASSAGAQECKNRGQLDTLYCDNNNDLVADAPTRFASLEGSGDAGIRLHARGRSRGLSQRVPPVHRSSCEVHRQARGVLPGAIELGADRGDAVGPPARRRLLHRSDRLRRQPRRAQCRSRSRAPKSNCRAITSSPSSRRRAHSRNCLISRANAWRTRRRHRIPAILRLACCFRRKGYTRT